MKLFVTIFFLTFNLAFSQIKTILINESNADYPFYFQFSIKKLNVLPLVKLTNPNNKNDKWDHQLGFNRSGLVNFRIYKGNLFNFNSSDSWIQNFKNTNGLNCSFGSMCFPYKNGKYLYIQQNPNFNSDSFRPIDLSIIDSRNSRIEVRNKPLKCKFPNLSFWVSRINTDSFPIFSISRNLKYLNSEILIKDSLIFMDTMSFVPYTPMICPTGFYESKGIVDIKGSNSGRFVLTEYGHVISIRYIGYNRKYLKYERTFNINEIDPITHKILPAKTLKNFLFSGDGPIVEKLINDSIFEIRRFVFSPLDSLLFQTYWRNGELRQYSMFDRFKLQRQTLAIKYQDSFFWFNPIITQDFSLLWATKRSININTGVVYLHRLKNADDGLKPGNLEQYFDSIVISDVKIYAPESFKRQLLNFAFVNHSIRYKCGEGIVQFLDASYTRKKFIKYDFQLDLLNGQFFKSNTPNCVIKFSKNGKYPFSCKFETADGYVELVEDTVEINLPKFYYFNDKIQVNLLSASVINHKCIQITWNKLDKTENYYVYRNGQLISEISDTFYNDCFSKDINQSYQYELIAIDSCGNFTGKSNVGKTIFLKAKVLHDKNSNDQFVSTLNWNHYENWNNGVDHYLIEDANSDDKISNSLDKSIDTFYRDKQFLEFNVAKKCYRITANDGRGNQSMSNVVCLEMPDIMYIPNAITINGDQLNDGLHITNTGFENITLEIFNRWGELVHKSSENEIKWYPSDHIIPGIYVVKITAFRMGKQSIFRENLTIIK